MAEFYYILSIIRLGYKFVVWLWRKGKRVNRWLRSRLKSS